MYFEVLPTTSTSEPTHASDSTTYMEINCHGNQKFKMAADNDDFQMTSKTGEHRKILILHEAQVTTWHDCV